MVLVQLAVAVIVLQVVLRPLLLAWGFARPPRLRVTYRTPADWDAPYEEVSFTSADGTRLAGWYIPSRNGAAVVLLHGHGGNRLAVAYHAEALSRAGYGVLMFDLRAHGDSGGRRFVRGSAAVEDARAAINWLVRRRDAPGRIGIAGVSVGGMLALQAAASHAFVRALAADGPILGTVDDLPPPRGLLDQLWYYPQERYYQAAIDWLTRSPRPLSNLAALARLAGRPVLFISTGRGAEQRLTRHFYDAAAQPKQLWQIPNATHAAGWWAEPEAYGRMLVSFFNRALFDEPGAGADEETPEECDAPATTDEAVPAPRIVDERTVSPPVAMMASFAVVPLAMIGLFIPFQLRWGLAPPRLPAGRPVAALLGVLALLLAGLLLHEAVHVAGYYLFGRAPRGSVRLGPGGAGFALRARCERPVSARAFRGVLVLPALLLGLLPGVVAVVAGSWLLVIWAVWMLVVAASDLVALWAMRDLTAATPVRAHTLRPGCEVLASEHEQNIDN